jgi:hypothetical protein
MDSVDVRPAVTSVERERSELAHVLAVSGSIAILFAYLCMFNVLGGTAYASKFENGELPAGFDATGGHTAAVVSLGAAAFAAVAIVAALSVRSSKVVGCIAILGLLAAMPYAVLELSTWQLAF